jgi:predicted ATPase
LVTLTGTGGCGKTRLALEVAASLENWYADGVWLVELAPLLDAEQVPAAVARCLGVSEQPGQDVSHTLVETLRNRRMLLVLDNCEHLVDACASLVVALLSACPSVRVLATSRERLRCVGETTWQVPPLAAPDPDHRLPVDALARYDAVQLFVLRARTTQTGLPSDSA